MTIVIGDPKLVDKNEITAKNIDEVEKKLKARCKTDCIKDLELVGHGDPSHISFNGIQKEIEKKDKPEGSAEIIAINNVRFFGRKLKPLMCKPCQIYLSSCDTGRLMGAESWPQWLADETGCKVTAPLAQITGRYTGEAPELKQTIAPGTDNASKEYEAEIKQLIDKKLVSPPTANASREWKPRKS